MDSLRQLTLFLEHRSLRPSHYVVPLFIPLKGTARVNNVADEVGQLTLTQSI